MRAERWKEIEELYQAALEKPLEKRAEFLLRACPTDPQLRGEVQSLLDQTADSFLEGAPVSVMKPPSAVLGRYHLLQKIGEGGMGEVWLAEQKEPVRRTVALKLVKAGMNTREVITRFESERQALALMDHPAIAKVFDAGSTPEGAPYFVMEYVAGVSITAYCDDHRLSTRERLELLVRVCEGVQHAHQKAIIHRDLKPSNILVTEVDGRPAPKIIDFGVAKALAQKLTADTLFTRVGALVGTPEYMSPEQANSSGEDIDTRTDVYSLGNIFYELLAGAPPLDLRKIAFDEFLRRLREDEPPKPSTKIRTRDHATSAEVARKRQTEPLALAKQMRGDLDSIALKALEKDRSRRYGSPSDFAADIGRYLKNEAVLAVPPSTAYRARKFARRNRAALLTACAFALVLILAAAVSIWQNFRATRQRNRADAEAAVAEAIKNFLQNDVLAQASAATHSGPKVKPDPDLKVRTALDRAAARIAGRFERQPEVEAAIRDTIGQTYIDLGLYPEARTQLERALDVQRRVLGEENPKTLRTASRLGVTINLQGKRPQSAALLRSTLDVQRRVLGSEHPDTLYSMTGLANAYESLGKYPEAEVLYRQTLDVQRRVLGAEHRDTLTAMNNLAVLYDDQGKYAQAETLFTQVLETRRGVLGAEHPDTLKSMNNLAVACFEQGKYARAEALYSQTLEIRRRVLGSEHPDTLGSINNLAASYYSQGKYAQAEALYSEGLAMLRRKWGPEGFGTEIYMAGLADAYSSEGKYAQAEAVYRQSLEMSRHMWGSENGNTLTILASIAVVYQRQGRYAMAETYAAQALTGRRHALGSEHPDTMSSAADLAMAYQSQGKFAESEPLAREAVEFNRKKQPDDWQRFRAESLFGASLAGQKKYADAEPLLLEGYQGMAARKERMAVPDRYHLDLARDRIVKLYQTWGNPEKAAEWKKK